MNHHGTKTPRVEEELTVDSVVIEVASGMSQFLD